MKLFTPLLQPHGMEKQIAKGRIYVYCNIYTTNDGKGHLGNQLVMRCAVSLMKIWSKFAFKWLHLERVWRLLQVRWTYESDRRLISSQINKVLEKSVDNTGLAGITWHYEPVHRRLMSLTSLSVWWRTVVAPTWHFCSSWNFRGKMEKKAKTLSKFESFP